MSFFLHIRQTRLSLFEATFNHSRSVAVVKTYHCQHQSTEPLDISNFSKSRSRTILYPIGVAASADEHL